MLITDTQRGCSPSLKGALEIFSGYTFTLVCGKKSEASAETSSFTREYKARKKTSWNVSGKETEQLVDAQLYVINGGQLLHEPYNKRTVVETPETSWTVKSFLAYRPIINRMIHM